MARKKGQGHSAFGRRGQAEPTASMDEVANATYSSEALGFIAQVEEAATQANMEIIPHESGGVRVGDFHLTKTGLVIAEGTPHDEWESIGKILFRLEDVIQWAFGDWLNYGSNHQWGKTYQKLATQFGYEVKTFRQYKWVASKVQMSLRRDTLKFEHHKLVASLDEHDQDYWLGLAAGGGWTVAELRGAMKPKPPTLPSTVGGMVDSLTPKAEALLKEFESELSGVGGTRQDVIAVLQAALGNLGYTEGD